MPEEDREAETDMLLCVLQDNPQPCWQEIKLNSGTYECVIIMTSKKILHVLQGHSKLEWCKISSFCADLNSLLHCRHKMFNLKTKQNNNNKTTATTKQTGNLSKL